MSTSISIVMTMMSLLLIVTNLSYSQTDVYGSDPYDIENMSEYEHYLLVQQINNNKPKSRNNSDYSHRVDSIYYSWTGQGQHPLRLVRKNIFSYSDTLEINKFYSLINGCAPSIFHKHTLDRTTGKPTSFSIHDNWDGSELAFDILKPKTLTLFQYNEKQLLEKVEFRTLLVHGLDFSQIEHYYSYDSLDNLISRKDFRRDFETDSLSLTRERRYDYNKQGLLEFVGSYPPPESINHNLPGDSFRYRYDSLGRVVEIRDEFHFSTDSIFLHHHSIFKYNDLEQTKQEIITPANFSAPLSYDFSRHYTFHTNGDPLVIDTWAREPFYNVLDSLKAWGYIRAYNNISNQNIQYPEYLAEHRLWKNGIKFERAYNNYVVPFCGQPADPDGYQIDFFYTDLSLSSTDDNREELDVSIFPNPAQNSISIQTDDIVGSLSLQLYDINGRQILQQAVSSGNDVDIATLTKGIYVYKLSNDTGSATGKLVVE